MITTTNHTEIPVFSSMHVGIKGNHPEQVFKFLAWEIAKSTGLLAVEIVDHLENYGQHHVAGIGDGVAIYDWKQPDITAPILSFARLEQAVPLISLDDRPVDIVITLISPESEGPLHLQRLSRLTRYFRDGNLLARLRDADCVDGITAILSESPAPNLIREILAA